MSKRETQSFIKGRKKTNPKQTKENPTPQTSMPVEINKNLNL